MSAVPQPDALDLEHVVAQFDIGSLLSARPVSSAPNNHRYFLHTQRHASEADFVLTFADAASLPASSFVTLLDRCADVGLPIAALVRTEKNLPYATSNGTPAFLAPRLTGRSVCNPTLSQLQAVGRFAARLHLGTASIEYLMPDFPKTVSWLHDQGQRLRGQVGYQCADLIGEAIVRVTSLLRRTDVGQLPTGVIHTALNRDSVLFNERGLTGVLNFDNAAQGPLLYDLAVAANDWCNDSSGVLDAEQMLALLKGYQAVRPLTKQELWFLPSFALYAALNTWLARLAADHAGTTSANDQPAPQRFSNPNELQSVVQQHLAHAFYLDERMLT